MLHHANNRIRCNSLYRNNATINNFSKSLLSDGNELPVTRLQNEPIKLLFDLTPPSKLQSKDKRLAVFILLFCGTCALKTETETLGLCTVCLWKINHMTVYDI